MLEGRISVRAQKLFQIFENHAAQHAFVAERELRDFLYGDRSQHILWEVGDAPADER